MKSDNFLLYLSFLFEVRCMMHETKTLLRLKICSMSLNTVRDFLRYNPPNKTFFDVHYSAIHQAVDFFWMCYKNEELLANVWKADFCLLVFLNVCFCLFDVFFVSKNHQITWNLLVCYVFCIICRYFHSFSPLLWIRSFHTAFNGLLILKISDCSWFESKRKNCCWAATVDTLLSFNWLHYHTVFLEWLHWLVTWECLSFKMFGSLRSNFCWFCQLNNSCCCMCLAFLKHFCSPLRTALHILWCCHQLSVFPSLLSTRQTFGLWIQPYELSACMCGFASFLTVLSMRAVINLSISESSVSQTQIWNNVPNQVKLFWSEWG